MHRGTATNEKTLAVLTDARVSQPLTGLKRTARRAIKGTTILILVAAILVVIYSII